MIILILSNEYPPHIYGGTGSHVDHLCHLCRELMRINGDAHSLQALYFRDQRQRFFDQGGAGPQIHGDILSGIHAPDQILQPAFKQTQPGT